MDIGTAKPSAAERALVPHQLVDVVWPDESFDAARFATLAAQAIDDIARRARVPLVVGGTGLYIRALTEGLVDLPRPDAALREQLQQQARDAAQGEMHRRLAAVDQQAARQLHPNDLVRIVRALEVFEQTGRPMSVFLHEHGFRNSRYRLLKIGLTRERDDLYRRIDTRAETMFAAGLIEETESLLAAGYSPQLKSMQTIGYREAVRLIRGECTRQQALTDLQQATRRYAKRQFTWFRADPAIIWVDSRADFDKIHMLIDRFHAA